MAPPKPKVLAFNCSLKSAHPREKSSTDALLKQLMDELAEHGAGGEVIRAVDFEIKPGVSSDEGANDAWPQLVDYKIREGKYPAVKADKLPYVPGRDIAGVVEACGGLVDDWKKGDAIFAMLGIERGGYAEYAIVKDTEAALFRQDSAALGRCGAALARRAAQRVHIFRQRSKSRGAA
jgi:hypothetical protein